MKICCVGYRDWALELYCKLSHHFDTLILKEFDETKLRKYKPTYVLFYGWSDIVDEKLLEDFDCIMLHPSPLPKYRGGTPLQNQIIRGEKDSAVTLFIMDSGIDTGAIIAQSPLSLSGHLSDIFDRIISIGFRLTKNIIENGFETIEQDHSKATYYKRRTPSMSEITKEELEALDGEYLCNKIRMLEDPYPNAFITMSDGRKLKIKLAEIE
tara:strand:+ start:2451 stop:3083 length:633 start_codon:yes stop_codon:yes gene_type:complete